MSNIGGGRVSAQCRGVALALIAGGCFLDTSAAFAQTRAGTTIDNVAHASADLTAGSAQIDSNPVSTRVAELLDVRLSAPATALPFMPGQRTAVAFTLTNAGNGAESFRLAASVPGCTVEGFAADANGDGAYDVATDAIFAPPVTPALQPGQSVALFALLRCDGNASVALGVSATAVTGSGKPGTLFPGAGDSGADAVVGMTSASAGLTFTLSPGASAGPTLEKSQAVTNRRQGTAPYRGATITYTLVARFPGAAWAASVSDPIPAGTTYTPGSLSVDGVALSDAADGDAGSFDGSAIHVALGDVFAPVARTIQFKVTIQ
ncbi:hypothetical protein [Sphingomonas sp.]|uniref:hypothetical protein n=1 Tax=Sphingomonas sp. TaxID=28214 RepID=UPI001B296584|nr:hypothetical protein [Sphingomonas sp.]MBO9712196.1 hypothetical protein [Sphingomonas sp.]